MHLIPSRFPPQIDRSKVNRRWTGFICCPSPMAFCVWLIPRVQYEDARIISMAIDRSPGDLVTWLPGYVEIHRMDDSRMQDAAITGADPPSVALYK